MVKLRQNFPSKYKKPEDSPGFLLWQVTNSWQRLMRRVLKEIGLTHVQFVLLTAVEWLNNAKIPATQKEVSRFANTDVMMTSQVIRALERKGLIIRIRMDRNHEFIGLGMNFFLIFLAKFKF